MTKLPNGDFVATIPIDRNKEHTFKFVIDNDWRCNPDYETTRDQCKISIIGFVINSEINDTRQTVIGND